MYHHSMHLLIKLPTTAPFVQSMINMVIDTLYIMLCAEGAVSPYKHILTLCSWVK